MQDIKLFRKHNLHRCHRPIAVVLLADGVLVLLGRRSCGNSSNLVPLVAEEEDDDHDEDDEQAEDNQDEDEDKEEKEE